MRWSIGAERWDFSIYFDDLSQRDQIGVFWEGLWNTFCYKSRSNILQLFGVIWKMHFLGNCLKIWSHLITFQARSKAEVWLELDHKNPVLCSNPIIGFLAFRLRKIAKDMLQTPKTCCKHFLRKTAFRADIFRVILSTKRCKNLAAKNWRSNV